MIEKQVKDAANEAIEIATSYGHSRCAIEQGLALACKGQPMSFKNAARAELNKRGFRI